MLMHPSRTTLFPYTTLFRSTNRLTASVSPAINPVTSTATVTNRAASTVTSQPTASANSARSEEHTSELQSRGHLVCRLLLEKKNKKRTLNNYTIRNYLTI